MSLETIKKYGGKIIKSIYDFPDGRRFHFADLAGNELAVWTEK
jgi:predicted enzyme related to lactoylglutathione lyase